MSKDASIADFIHLEAQHYSDDPGFPPLSKEDEELIDMGKGPHVILEPEDAARVMAHLKEAVDDKAKDYYEDYYGGFGKQLVKDIALKPPAQKSSQQNAKQAQLLYADWAKDMGKACRRIDERLGDVQEDLEKVMMRLSDFPDQRAADLMADHVKEAFFQAERARVMAQSLREQHLSGRKRGQMEMEIHEQAEDIYEDLSDLFEDLYEMREELESLGMQDAANGVDTAVMGLADSKEAMDAIMGHHELEASRKVAQSLPLEWKKVKAEMKEQVLYQIDPEEYALSEQNGAHGALFGGEIYFVGGDGRGQFKWQCVSPFGSLVDSGGGYDSLERAKGECERDYSRKSVGAEKMPKMAQEDSRHMDGRGKLSKSGGEWAIFDDYGGAPIMLDDQSDGDRRYDSREMDNLPYKILDNGKAKILPWRQGSQKQATNEGGIPPAGHAVFGDSVDAQKKPWGPAMRGSVIWIEDTAIHGDRNEAALAWDPRLNTANSPLQMKHHIKTFVQELGTQMEKNWGIVSDIQVVQMDYADCHAVVTFRCSLRSAWVMEERVTELRHGLSPDSREPAASERENVNMQDQGLKNDWSRFQHA